MNGRKCRTLVRVGLVTNDKGPLSRYGLLSRWCCYGKSIPQTTVFPVAPPRYLALFFHRGRVGWPPGRQLHK